jgi:hypothetical protein
MPPTGFRSAVLPAARPRPYPEEAPGPGGPCGVATAMAAARTEPTHARDARTADRVNHCEATAASARARRAGGAIGPAATPHRLAASSGTAVAPSARVPDGRGHARLAGEPPAPAPAAAPPATRPARLARQHHPGVGGGRGRRRGRGEGAVAPGDAGFFPSMTPARARWATVTEVSAQAGAGAVKGRRAAQRATPSFHGDHRRSARLRLFSLVPSRRQRRIPHWLQPRILLRGGAAAALPPHGLRAREDSTGRPKRNVP